MAEEHSALLHWREDVLDFCLYLCFANLAGETVCCSLPSSAPRVSSAHQLLDYIFLEAHCIGHLCVSTPLPVAAPKFPGFPQDSEGVPCTSRSRPSIWLFGEWNQRSFYKQILISCLRRMISKHVVLRNLSNLLMTSEMCAFFL